MLKDLISVAAIESGLEEPNARHAVGIVFNAAQRQGGDLIERIFAQVPGARTLSASTAKLEGTPIGAIAQLIEQTPGGRQHVTFDMFLRLQRAGLGHSEIASLMSTISRVLGARFSLGETALIAALFEGSTPAIPADDHGRSSAVA
ncbi:hypothetical protein D1224_03930 [Henriciella barbarensis]|uniref:DUF2267 domain-containing protein n=1 Tax=Henriciella barbarensis TaxID=86342 RepID=A0A399QYW9_9PROT|nr:hypothetical protein [Henriciella barbarensis]RIJ23424.1 hypothetical protein D1224_03930 [Henriciella barbarensis]